MTDTTEGETTGGTDTGTTTAQDGGGAVEAVGTYESGDAVVFYDTENPLAWIQSREAIPLEEAV
jgi:hypothetical protein